MILYTCPAGTMAGTWPGPAKHPCGRAAHALDEAGHSYDVRKVGGFKALGFTRRGQRDEVRELSGQEDVPILVLDDGQVVTGNQAIVDWAGANPA
jgi:glutathione S-transferase